MATADVEHRSFGKTAHMVLLKTDIPYNRQATCSIMLEPEHPRHKGARSGPNQAGNLLCMVLSALPGLALQSRCGIRSSCFCQCPSWKGRKSCAMMIEEPEPRHDKPFHAIPVEEGEPRRPSLPVTSLLGLHSRADQAYPSIVEML